MTGSHDSLDNYIDAVANALRLPLESTWKLSIKSNLAVTLEHARLVDAFPLPDDAEPAPVFRV